jgi:hypothetical protein
MTGLVVPISLPVDQSNIKEKGLSLWRSHHFVRDLSNGNIALMSIKRHLTNLPGGRQVKCLQYNFGINCCKSCGRMEQAGRANFYIIRRNIICLSRARMAFMPDVNASWSVIRAFSKRFQSTFMSLLWGKKMLNGCDFCVSNGEVRMDLCSYFQRCPPGLSAG